ncbi:MAG: hypothetical protein MNPFHGCM_00854 [Gemmatimonadaceae bacterium]|nr:hypothetical protein [Gemmatimonadaceae bacterium]
MALGVATARRTQATARLASIADSLRSVSCLTLTSGTDSTAGVRVDWRIARGNVSRSMILSATFADRTSHTLVTESLVPCD